MTRILVFIMALAVAPIQQGIGAQVYFANLHAHTSFSDGIGTPEEAYAYARDVADIDVLALTEHTHMLSSSEWNHLLAAATAYTFPGEFVALGAQEFGNLNDFGHLGIYDSMLRNPNETTNLLGSYQFMLDQGAIGNFNHPNPIYGTNFNDLTYYPQYRSVMVSIEIRNGLRADNYEPQYIQALRNGWRLGPFGNQDNHEGSWGDQQNWNSGGQIYLTGILADELSAPAILEALRARRFFAMEVDPPSDRIGLEFFGNGQPMGSEVISGVHLDLTASAWSLNGTSLFNRVDLFRDGELIDSRVQIGTRIDVDFAQVLTDGESHHYFVRARQVDGDRAWSAPIWVTCEADPAAAHEEPGLQAAWIRSSPNPVRGACEFAYFLPAPAARPSSASIEIYAPAGRQVADLSIESPQGGPGRREWDSRHPRLQPAGVYIAVLRIDGVVRQTSRVVVLP